jgi:hypothetical protein
MPCYEPPEPEPDARHKNRREAARLMIYVFEMLKTPVPGWLYREAKNQFNENEDLIPTLCKMVRLMTEAEFEAIVYNARDRRSRDLADWWEEHQKADEHRMMKEKKGGM